MAQRRIISIRPSAANSQRRTSLFERPGRPTSPGERMGTASQMFREEQPRMFAHIKKGPPAGGGAARQRVAMRVLRPLQRRRARAPDGQRQRLWAGRGRGPLT
jgi:hypothetical protein